MQRQCVWLTRLGLATGVRQWGKIYTELLEAEQLDFGFTVGLDSVFSVSENSARYIPIKHITLSDGDVKDFLSCDCVW